MRILICGDRKWTCKATIHHELKQHKISEIIQGECTGADTLGKEVALSMGFLVRSFPARWFYNGKLDRSAGPRRNKEMLATNPDLVLAFHTDLDHSKGTKHMVKLAREKGIPVKIISHQI